MYKVWGQKFFFASGASEIDPHLQNHGAAPVSVSLLRSLCYCIRHIVLFTNAFAKITFINLTKYMHQI